MVGGRHQTKLVEGVHKQVDVVRAVLADAGVAEVPVRGVLCFVEANWPLIGGSFVIDGVSVIRPKKLAEQLVATGTTRVSSACSATRSSIHSRRSAVTLTPCSLARLRAASRVAAERRIVMPTIGSVTTLVSSSARSRSGDVSASS